jgi:hypothetical protein
VVTTGIDAEPAHPDLNRKSERIPRSLLYGSSIPDGCVCSRRNSAECRKIKRRFIRSKGVCRSNRVLMIAGWGIDVKKKHNSRYVFRSESTRCGVHEGVEFVEFGEFIGFIEVTAQV